MKYKVCKKAFRFSFSVFLIAFLVLYFSQGMGYFEYKNHQKAVLTSKQIEEFEKDVASGKDVDVKDYLPKDTQNYQNSVSSAGLKVSSFAKDIVNSTVENGFKALGKLAGL